MAIKDDQERYYTNAGDMYGVLRSLQNERSGINIQFAGSETYYNSLILDVNIREHYFLLDEVTPRDGHRLAETGTAFAIRASINGIRVHAKDLKVARTMNDASGILYRVAFPERMLYLQRRDAFRARVPGAMMVNAEVSSPSRGKMQGKVLDMSATGIRIGFAGEVTPELQVMETFDARISFPAQDMEVESRFELRFHEYNKLRDQTICGFHYADLGRVAQLAISRFVTQLQREGIA